MAHKDEIEWRPGEYDEQIAWGFAVALIVTLALLDFVLRPEWGLFG